MSVSDSDSQAPDPAGNPDSAPATSGSRILRRIAVGAFIAVFVYLLSYGPAVTRALNQYGQISDFYRAFYTPADWIADHNGLFHSYRIFWAKKSRNYHWWLRRESKKDTNPLLPPSKRPNREPPMPFQPRPAETPQIEEK